MEARYAGTYYPVLTARSVSPSTRGSSPGPRPRSTRLPATLRFDETSELVLDEGWRKSLSPLRRRAIDFGTLISRQTLRKTGPVR
jgi:hypothetical protein